MHECNGHMASTSANKQQSSLFPYGFLPFPTCACVFMPVSAGVTCRIMTKIGEGGFATIYKAVTADRSEVAVKVRHWLQCVLCGTLRACIVPPASVHASLRVYTDTAAG